MSPRLPLLAVVAGAALAAPASASAAAALAVREPCVVRRDPVTVSGTGFTPGARVVLRGRGVVGAGVADLFGSFLVRVRAPRYNGTVPRTVVLRAREAGTRRPGPMASFRVIRELFWANYADALAGPPRQQTLWHFAGFARGAPVVGHFVYAGNLVRSFRFGIARGACGTVDMRARRVPVSVPRPGRWSLQIDQTPRYDAATPVRRFVTFQIFR